MSSAFRACPIQHLPDSTRTLAYANDRRGGFRRSSNESRAPNGSATVDLRGQYEACQADAYDQHAGHP